MTTFDNLAADTNDAAAFEGAKAAAPGTDEDALFRLPAQPGATSRHTPTAGQRVQSDSRPAGARAATVQWRAETFQLVNWGGFEGRHVFSFAPGSTLISGASGTGKSTLLDAYIALMMPGDTAFNGASNEAGGRARNPDQRNLLSYLRGKTDTTSDDGQSIDKVLRGGKSATWGAIGMTFRNDEGRYFTALRIYYAPARASRASEITMRLATIDEELDLAELEALLDIGDPNQRFAGKTLRGAFEGIRPYTSYGEFAQALYSRLDIGANGDGEKALRLLVRIQAGTKISTVDALYKDTVLERPTTYEKADQAIAHFDDLDAAYQAMVTEQKKAEILAPITGRWESLTHARQGIATLDALGQGARGELTPLSLWALRTRSRLLDQAVNDNRAQRQETAQAGRTAAEKEEAAETALQVARQAHNDAGGATIDAIDLKITDREQERGARANRHARLIDDTQVLEAMFTSADVHDTRQAAARGFLDGFIEEQQRLQQERDQLRDERLPILQLRQHMRDERASLAGRSGRVPRSLDELRRVVATAAKMDPDDLPFVAELIDVMPEEAAWRTAIETVLYSSARIMLVPAGELDDFSRAIDSLALRGRLNFQGVEASSFQPYATDRSRISGKLTYKDSPFAKWVFEHVSSPSRDALCVEKPEELVGEGLRVTPNGQTRKGQRGAHGRAQETNIIGFSSEEAIAEIEANLAETEEPLQALEARLSVVESETEELTACKSAHEAILRTTWAEIDTAGVEEEIRQLRENRERLLKGDRRLAEISAEIRRIEGDLKFKLTPARSRLSDRAEELAKDQDKLVDAQDANELALERIEADGSVLLTEADATWLDDQLATACAPGDPNKLSDLDANLGRLNRTLSGERTSHLAKAKEAEEELSRVFGQYKSFWDDPNLGVSAESYPDYAEILDNILRTGLHERRHEWRRRLTRWSGEDLVPLSSALDTAVEEIEDRLVPINDILAQLPFGAGRDRLRIKLRKLNSDAVSTFRVTLRQLAGAATRALPDAETERRFKELQAFMATFRERDDIHLTPQLRELCNRDNLLDVRRHVEITAERYDAENQLLSTYASISDKSGGETQELAAFIVGAALRFRLGDEQRSRPRFAPVFLDEGFIKADSQFAGRAVEAWKGLGFQLIIGAPLDKVSALEPHMDQFLAITKDTVKGYSFVARISDPPTAPQSPASGQALSDASDSAAGGDQR